VLYLTSSCCVGNPSNTEHAYSFAMCFAHSLDGDSVRVSTNGRICSGVWKLYPVKASSGRIIKSSCGSRGTFVRRDVARAMFCWTAPSEGEVWRMAIRMRGGRNAREIKESVLMS
jgi:hypothetical protein